MNTERLERHACFGGWQDVYRHRSRVLDCAMTVGVYFPPQAAHAPCPVLYWLSGLTCTEQNFITKAGAQQHAAEHGVILVAPDTSPRGLHVTDADGYDIGQGAGFYVDATQSPWDSHYRMYDYIVHELPAWVEADPAASDVRAISGHSMGGHGALTIALRNAGRYRSVSAFSPIVAPTQVPWGRKAFSTYLGEDESAWAAHDSVELVKSRANPSLALRVEQGGADEFMDSQLKPELLRAACEAAGQPLDLRVRQGYDHSYYFIGSFIGEHVAYHAEAMRD